MRGARRIFVPGGLYVNRNYHMLKKVAGVS